MFINDENQVVISVNPPMDGKFDNENGQASSTNGDQVWDLFNGLCGKARIFALYHAYTFR